MSSLVEELALNLSVPGFLPFYPLAVITGLLVAYLLGAIPVALIVSKAVAGIDIREHGSGNTGFTNALRVLGVGPGIVVLVFDVLKGALGGLTMVGLLLISRDLIVGQWLASQVQALNDPTAYEATLSLLSNSLSGPLHDLPCAAALLASVLGHMFSPFMGFKGGKGIATGLGGMLVLMPIVALLALAVFLVFTFSVRIVSVGSLAAAISLPFITWWMHSDSLTYIVFCSLTTLVLVYAHRQNIKRLIKGTEQRFSMKRRKES